MKTPIGRESNFSERSVMKNSALNIAGSSEVLNPIKIKMAFDNNPTTGSPRITETTIRLFSHQGNSTALDVHAVDLSVPRIVFPAS